MSFSDKHDNYHSGAYRYIHKEDDSVHHCKHHPSVDAAASPPNEKSTQAYQQSRKSNALANSTDVPP